jgi:hypothetical protein
MQGECSLERQLSKQDSSFFHLLWGVLLLLIACYYLLIVAISIGLSNGAMGGESSFPSSPPSPIPPQAGIPFKCSLERP